MKLSPRLFLAAVLASTCGISGLTQAAHATQSPTRLLSAFVNQSTQIAEADSPNDRDSGAKEDGDRESSDAPQVHKNRISYTKQHRKHYGKYHHTRKSRVM